MKPLGLQDFYLNEIRKKKITATFFLVNGFQLKGIVSAFDAFTVVLLVGTTQQMVYKHAISTIMPVRPIDLSRMNPEIEQTSQSVEIED